MVFLAKQILIYGSFAVDRYFDYWKMLFDQCSFSRNNTERNFVFQCRLSLTYRRLSIFVILFLLLVSIWFNSTLKSADRVKGYNHTIHSKQTNQSTNPTIARILYLFLCENQAEVDAYAESFPSVSADAIFYCWNENCRHSAKFRPTKHLYVNIWSSETRRNATLVSFQSISTFYSIQSRVFILNEKQFNVTEKLTWTTSRNYLYQFALNEERKQGWTWSYYIFSDGDVHTVCPLAEQLLTNKTLIDYGGVEEYVFAPHFYTLMSLTNITVEEEKCFLLFDAFLLSASPAIAIIRGAGGVLIYPGVLTQVVYHVDAMFNAIQHDALPFVLPYCSRYDKRSWWTSQAIFVYRSLCLYGHSLFFDGLHIAKQNHRSYPRQGDPWAMDNDMNLVPNHLLRLRDHMKQGTFVSPLVLDHYSGWNLQLTSEVCRRNYTAMKLDTCLVHGEM